LQRMHCNGGAVSLCEASAVTFPAWTTTLLAMERRPHTLDNLILACVAKAMLIKLWRVVRIEGVSGPWRLSNDFGGGRCAQRLGRGGPKIEPTVDLDRLELQAHSLETSARPYAIFDMITFA
jgi:hypothetical protein